MQRPTMTPNMSESIMNSMESRLQVVKGRILAACSQAGRSADGVELLAVSKTFGAETVRQAFAAGQRAFGENYVQEALDKIAALADLRAEIQWHMIGPLQSNKTRGVAEAFDWVHSVDRFKIAQRLAEQRPAHLPPLNVCLQVNVSGEASKGGVALAELAALALQVAALPARSLRLRGLMSIPAPAVGLAAQREPHRLLREQLQQLQAELQRELHHTPSGQSLQLDTLSMGMSDDLEAAVLEGATCVRVGSAIFGQRTAAA